MQAKHTPGPWDIHGDSTQQVYYIHGANRICDITKPNGFYRSPAETDANARLIAAAPDLLAALETIDANAAESVEWIRRVTREAIARARGES